MNRSNTLIFAIFLFVVSTHGQTAAVTDAAIVRGARSVLAGTATESGPGVAVLVARGNRVIYRSARGQANIELGVPLSPDQVFRIASVTKTFTAALVIKLAESGELSLDDKLARFLPDFPSAATITIRELLSHTAGISDQSVPGSEPLGFSRRDVDMATLIAGIAKRPPAFPPGSDQAYSNAGFIVLGAVIEKATGKPWYTALQDRILDPLHLRHTTYGLASRILPGRVNGYTTDMPNHGLANGSLISMTIPASAGSLVSTVDDLHSWMLALTNGRVVSAADFRQMITPAIVPGGEPMHPYGLGMYIWHVRGETMIGHTGQINGFASILAYLPSRDITIVALGNDDNFDAQSFGRRLAAIALGKPYPSVKSVQILATDLITIPGEYRDGSGVRTLFAKDGKLYSQREGRKPSPLQMTAGGELHFVPDELSYLVPVRDRSGKVVRLDYYDHGDGPPKALPRLDVQGR